MTRGEGQTVNAGGASAGIASDFPKIVAASFDLPKDP